MNVSFNIEVDEAAKLQFMASVLIGKKDFTTLDDLKERYTADLFLSWSIVFSLKALAKWSRGWELNPHYSGSAGRRLYRSATPASRSLRTMPLFSLPRASRQFPCRRLKLSSHL